MRLGRSGKPTKNGRSQPTAITSGSGMYTARSVITSIVAGSVTLWAASLLAATPAAAQGIRAVVGGTLIDGTGSAPVRDAVVLIREGRIHCAGSRAKCQVPRGAARFDARGLWIIPGLIDAHVHFSQTGWFDGRPDAGDLRDSFPYAAVMAGLEAHPERFLSAYHCAGVTSVFDVGGYPWTWALRRRFASECLRATHCRRRTAARHCRSLAQSSRPAAADLHGK